MYKAIITATLTSIILAAPADVNNNITFDALNKFTLTLLDHTFAFQDNFGRTNFAICPVSVWSMFALIAEGSAGETFRELMTGLNLPNDLKSTQLLQIAVRKLLHSDKKDVTLKGQSAMFNDRKLDIHPEFCQAAISYDTDIYSVDPSNTTKLAQDINYYICLATEGKITNVIDAGILENLRLILVDALYFKAIWTHTFNPMQTKEDDFYDSKGKSIGKVNMMFHKAPHNFGVAQSIGAEILEMNYGKDEQYSMLILQPFDGMPLKRLLGNLSEQNLDWIREFKIGGGNLPHIDVYVPRFKISSKLDLIPALQYSGVNSVFDSALAQLPGVSDSPLFVSKTIQTVEIEVNEEGTTAAAATVIGLEDRILGQRFEANKEFVFLITERKSNLILFAGIYSDPSVV